jgi:hypothetical protein
MHPTYVGKASSHERHGLDKVRYLFHGEKSPGASCQSLVSAVVITTLQTRTLSIWRVLHFQMSPKVFRWTRHGKTTW